MNKPVIEGPVDGNIFAILGAARKALKRAGQRDKVEEMTTRVTSSKSYYQALAIIMDYVDL